MTVHLDRGSSVVNAGPAPAGGATSPRGRAERGRRLRRRLLSIAVGAVGVGALLALLPRMQPLYSFDVIIAPIGLRAGSTVVLVLVGLTLIATARQLSRGKRAAWWVSVVLLAVAIVMAVVQRGHLGASVFGAVLLVALLVWRRDFQARPDPPSVWRALWFVLVWIASVLTLGMAALLAEGRRMTPDFDVVGALQTIGAGLIGLEGQYTYTNALFARAFPAALLALSVFGLVMVATLLFRAGTSLRRVGPRQRRQASDLVHRYGSDTLSYFALREDKSYFFSSDGRSMVAYAYLRDHALVSGDPIGCPDSFGLVIDEFLDFCHGHGWKVAFLAVHDAHLPVYRERGLVDMYLGDEAVVHCASLSLDGRNHRNARQAVNRAVRSHHTFELLRETDADALLLRDLSAISNCWRGDGTERGFGMTMGQGITGTDPEILLAVARDSAGRPDGFLRLVPCFGSPSGYSLDVMRRLPNSVNGVMEYLILETSRELARRGVSTLSLNFAVWARLQPADAELSPLDRLLKWGADRSGQQVRSLYTFNEKFTPEWRPRSVVAESTADLPRVWFLYGGVEGFYARVPVLGAMMKPRVVSA